MRSWLSRRRTKAAGNSALLPDLALATRMDPRLRRGADPFASSQEWLPLAARQGPSPERWHLKTRRDTCEPSIPSLPNKPLPTAQRGAANSRSTKLRERYDAFESAKRHPQ